MKGWQFKFCFFISGIILFALIYYRQLKGHIKDEDRMTEAFYNSILTQTLTGSSSPPPTTGMKQTIMLQSFLGFCFVSGFILHLLQIKIK